MIIAEQLNRKSVLIEKNNESIISIMFNTPILSRVTFSTQTISNGHSLIVQNQGHANGSTSKFYIFNTESIVAYEYHASSKSWQQKWKRSIANKEIIYFPNKVNQNDNLAISKTSQNINFYELKDDDFISIELNQLPNLNHSNTLIKAGYFFYNQTSIGLLTSHQHRFEFYLVQRGVPENTHIIQPFSVDLSILGNCSKSEFIIADIQRNGQDNIIILDEHGLHVYKFNERNRLERLMKVLQGVEFKNSEQAIFFPNLTTKMYQDLVLFNKSGLFMYQFDDQQIGYNLYHYNPLFSEVKGWTMEHTNSVIFQDINMDKRQEMLFTGPHGIEILSFNINANQWISVLDNSQLSAFQRHGKVMGFLPSNPPTLNNSIIFVSYEDELHWGYIESLEISHTQIQTKNTKENKTLKEDEIKPQQIPQLFKESQKSEISIILSRDQLDCSSMMNAVDLNTGKVHFSVPLIDGSWAKNIKFNLIYNSIVHESDILGVGWSTQANFIAMDHHLSIYPESEEYYAIIQGIPQKLMFNSKNSTNIISSFTFANNLKSEWKIYYYKKEEKWKIEGPNIKLIYGQGAQSSVHPVAWEVKWENWRGVGNSLKEQIRIANCWYLIEKHEDGDVTKLMYDVIELSVPGGKNFTREIYLKNIISKQNRVTFEYKSKESNEYEAPPIIDKNGFFVSQMVQSRYLDKFTISTPKYYQSINFIYKMIRGKRFLIEIKQNDDPVEIPVLQFIYQEVSGIQVLKKMTLPMGSQIEYTYNSVTQSNTFHDDPGFLRYEVPTNHKIHFIKNDIFISFLNEQAKVEMNIFDQAIKNASPISLYIGHGLVKDYEIKHLQDFIATICYSSNTELYLLQKENSTWVKKLNHTFSKDVRIQFGTDFILTAEKNNLIEIITCNLDSKSCEKKIFKSGTRMNSRPPLLFTVFERTFVVYDNSVLWIAYKDINQNWKSREIQMIPHALESITYTLDKFDIDEEMNYQLLQYFTNNALQINENLIALSRWDTSGTHLLTALNLFTLNSTYQLVKQSYFSVRHENIEEVEIDRDGTNGTSLKIGYEKIDRKFKLVIKDVKGPIIEKLKKDLQFNKAMFEEKKKEIMNLLTKSLEKDFLLNPSRYITIFNPPLAICGNMKFTFDGYDWKNEIFSIEKLTKSDAKTSLILSDKFILHKKTPSSSISLYQRDFGKILGNGLVNLEITNFDDIFNAYPIYLAYKNSVDKVSIIEFSSTGDFRKVRSLSSYEKLSFWSNNHVLITTFTTVPKQNKVTLIFRQMSGIEYLLPNPVVTTNSLLFNNETRVTGYDYSSPKVFYGTVYYEKSHIIPANEKFSFGWIEEVKDYNNPSKNKQLIYDSEKHLIKTLTKEHVIDNDNQSDESNKHLNSTIFDISEKLKVAEFFIDNVLDDEASYYGFEYYEKNDANFNNPTKTSKKWLFHQNDVVENEFSLTGKNLLRLSKETLQASFQPKHQHRNYVASCWMRLEDESSFNNTFRTPYLKAHILTENDTLIHTRFGEIKYRLNDWYYLEVSIDFLSAKHTYNLQINLNNSKINDYKLKTSIVVSPENNTTIEIDHIRFSSTNSYFNANIYDNITTLRNSKINSNGLIDWYIYDQYQKEIANIDQYGKVEKFYTYTKSSSIGRIVQLYSNILIQPQSGVYENFAPHSFEQRWKIDSSHNWKISPGQLYHTSTNQNTMQLNFDGIDSDSFGLRINLIFESDRSSIKFGRSLMLERNGNTAAFIVKGQKSKMPLNAELLIVKEQARLLTWIDGGLYFDGVLSGFSFNPIIVSGQLKLYDVIIFNNSSIQVTYTNWLFEKLQTVILENEDSAIVTEYLYDELGRQTITTQPTRIKRSTTQSLLSYYPDFVINKTPRTKESVWEVGRLEGGCAELNGAHNYVEVRYDKNPLNHKNSVGLPGKEFSIRGPLVNKFSSSCDNLYINDVYSIEKNYTHEVVHKPGGVNLIIVTNDKKNIVAKYVEIPSSGDQLTTYEYDNNGHLVKMLPPMYHKKSETLIKNDFSQGKLLSKEKILLQKSLGTHITYDQRGNVLSKLTQDTQKVEYMYNEDDLIIFEIHYNHENVENVIYFDRDILGRLRETGELTVIPSKIADLRAIKLTKNNTVIYQQFHNSLNEPEPILRHNTKQTITFNDDTPLIEESIFNKDEQILSKRIILPLKDDLSPSLISINKKYSKKKLIEIVYPLSIQNHTLKIYYHYNKLDQVTAIGVSRDIDEEFIKFGYNAGGHIVTEQHLPNRFGNFTRQYTYNSIGFITHLHDDFLKEEIYYTTNSYGGTGYADGTITATKFQATWHEHCTEKNLGLNEHSFITETIDTKESELCFHALKGGGYLDNNKHQVKTFYPMLNPNLPIICSVGTKSRTIQRILGEKGFPTHYGYTYDYGNYMELTKAKYFVGIQIPQPLQPDTFSKHSSKINITLSHAIWESLRHTGYLVVDNEKNDPSYSNGKAGKSFSSSTLLENLSQMGIRYKKFGKPLQKMLTSYFCEKLNLKTFQQNLSTHIQEWVKGTNETEIYKITQDIIEMLDKNHYFQKPFSEDFINVLNKYKLIILDIACTLVKYFGMQLGEGEFDVESNLIDINGNHKQFYTGFDRYELFYHENTNQISTVKYKSFSSFKSFENFSMKYDHRGNVIQALHKGIQNIEYNLVSNRVTKMLLINGNCLIFHYNEQGERILKRFMNKKGEIIHEIHYIRDELGQTLVERKIISISKNLSPDILSTAYIYGPKGLLGFIRHNLFHSVITDHEGSIRLIVRGSEVLAAYDYLPYGNLMRKYCSNPDSHISYLYTGQELDDEVGLYNFHARFYDPNTGRFYQIDPKEQYPSSYKYSGNSPISVIDPDGEFALPLGLTFAGLIFGAIGAYLKASLQNHSFNPLDWNFDISTIIALIEGAMTGYTIPNIVITPLGILATIPFIYFNTATVNNEWDPRKWRWTSTDTIVTVAESIIFGLKLPSSVSGANHTIAQKLGKKTGIAGIVLSILPGIYFNQVLFNNGSWNPMQWDFTSPKTYKTILKDGLFFTQVKKLSTETKTIFDNGVQIVKKLNEIHLRNKLEKESNNLNKDISPIINLEIEQQYKWLRIPENKYNDLIKNLPQTFPQDVKHENNFNIVMKKHIVEWIQQKDLKQDSNISKLHLHKIFNNKPEIIEGIFQNLNFTLQLNQLAEIQGNFHTSWNSENEEVTKTLIALVKPHRYVHPRNHNIVEIEDILYIGAYHVPNPMLKEKCHQIVGSNCRDFVNFVMKNIITDMAWLYKIENVKLSTQYSGVVLSPPVFAETRNKLRQFGNQRSYFNLPLNFLMTNQLEKEKDNDLEGLKKGTNKQKRSTFYNTSVVFKQNDLNMKLLSENINNHQKISQSNNDGTKQFTGNASNASFCAFDWFTWFKNPMKKSGYNQPHIDLLSQKTKSDSSTKQMNAKIDVNCTLLLLEVLVRKITGRNFIPSINGEESSPLELQGQVIAIITEFEEILEETARESGISAPAVNFDPIEVQNILIRQLRQGHFSQMLKTLYFYVGKTNNKLWKNETFLKNLKKNLENVNF